MSAMMAYLITSTTARLLPFHCTSLFLWLLE